MQPVRPASERAALWHAHLASLLPIRAWDINGRLAVHEGDHGGQMSLRWHREGDHARVQLVGPFGKQLLSITAGPDGARAIDDRRRVFTAPDAQTLLRKMTGWQLPLRGLDYWVLGAPVPNVAQDAHLDNEGRLARLRQLGWDIRFIDYGNYQGRVLPRLLSLSAPTADPQTPIELRLVIESWRVGS